ncbi:MAG: hypothetical protein JRF72_11115 [Deltaproteobacteria bacterium]|jgi:MFS superfamily sulfate permease-like transporter|nr:hypothetical protein [Deltaproteobacteria bacterium]
MRKFIPLLEWLPGYRGKWLRADLIAGLTAAAVVIPKAMAYATIANLPVQVGLYTAFVPLVLYAVLGTSRPLSTRDESSSPTPRTSRNGSWTSSRRFSPA